MMIIVIVIIKIIENKHERKHVFCAQTVPRGTTALVARDRV